MRDERCETSRKNRIANGLSKREIVSYVGYLKILNEKVWK